MQSIVEQLRKWFSEALTEVAGEAGQNADPLLRANADDKFGDYQSNVAMSLAKQLGCKPRDLANRIVNALPPAVHDACEPFEVAGPGFINIRLRPQWLGEKLEKSERQDAKMEDENAVVQRVVVDYSSPNIAKQMHVGHLRSSIIGDAIAHVLEFQGHTVVRQNHIGDWGTQFGMLCAYLMEKMPQAMDDPSAVHLADLEAFYKEANALDKADHAFHERARAQVVALHQHDPVTLKAWRYIVDESRNHYMPVYRQLNVNLRQEDERGESFYAERLAPVVKELWDRFGADEPATGMDVPDGIRLQVKESDGAMVVFHTNPANEPLFKNADGDPLPLIIRKSDGAFLYATTDLAAIKYRINELNADRIIYVTDARQALHFEMVFATARAAGWTRRPGKSEVQLEHVTFGSILGPDRKPLKTRSGENVKLSELLEEAVGRAETLIRSNEADPDKKRGFTEEEIHDIANAVGIGAVKYADLSQNRQSDYIFSWDKMLALEGNTAPYLMYAYARIRSIYRKGAENGTVLSDTGQMQIEQPAEKRLALQILRFAEIIESVATGLRLNLLSDYLYELSGLFMKFYETCPVLGADSDQQRASRLRLCDLTATLLKSGLQLLGIRVVERM